MSTWKNYKLIEEKGLTLHLCDCLQLVKQLRTDESMFEYVVKYLTETDYKELVENGYAEHIKKKKKDEHHYKSLRLTKKGTQTVDSIHTYNSIQKDIDMFNKAKQWYIDREDDDYAIGNEKKIIRYITFFRCESGFNIYQVYYLLKHFIENEKYTKKMEYVFWNDNKNRYGKPTLEDSRLWEYYCENREEIEHIWRNDKYCDYV